MLLFIQFIYLSSYGPSIKFINNNGLPRNFVSFWWQCKCIIIIVSFIQNFLYCSFQWSCIFAFCVSLIEAIITIANNFEILVNPFFIPHSTFIAVFTCSIIEGWYFLVIAGVCVHSCFMIVIIVLHCIIVLLLFLFSVVSAIHPVLMVQYLFECWSF